MIEIRSATDPASLDAARSLVREHILAVTQDAADVGRIVALLPSPYVPPTGALWVAWLGDAAVGCIAMQEIAPSIAELKRVYVRPAARLFGVGRHLTEHAIGAARESGYLKLRLATMPTQHAAQALYASLGFKRIEPYRPGEFGDALCYELPLTPSHESQSRIAQRLSASDSGFEIRDSGFAR